ncbi:hypothetical protein [Marisediminicola sp. LYQ85]|uniref:hypothetical protein n=1 Tax=Marisediminicola sp. LYQ85 TaxID=3391062 RepID=UPI0039835F91
MNDLADTVIELGGMAQKQQLVKRGFRDRDLTRAVRAGDVVRARNGWYSTLPETDARLRAVRVGGRLTGVSSIAERGGWVTAAPVLHVAAPPNAARLRSQHNRFRRLAPSVRAGVVVHWSDHAGDRGDACHVPVLDALERVVLDEPLEVAVACLDWALCTAVLDRVDFETLILRLPGSVRWIADWVDDRCDSLPESLARTRLRAAGHLVQSQVLLGTGEPIDLVVDGEIALEVDGERWHWDRFERDRRKDLTITLSQRHALRPSARMVFGEWDVVVAAVLCALSARGVSAPSPVENSGARVARRRPGPRSRRTTGPPRAGLLNLQPGEAGVG